MPRVRLSRKQYARSDLIAAIPARMKAIGLTQEKAAEAFGTTQSSFCRKAKALRFTYDELIRLFEMLGFGPDEILYYMTGRRGYENDF